MFLFLFCYGIVRVLHILWMLISYGFQMFFMDFSLGGYFSYQSINCQIILKKLYSNFWLYFWKPFIFCDWQIRNRDIILLVHLLKVCSTVWLKYLQILIGVHWKLCHDRNLDYWHSAFFSQNEFGRTISKIDYYLNNENNCFKIKLVRYYIKLD